MKPWSVPHHSTNEALILKCLSCQMKLFLSYRQVSAPLKGLPAPLCAFCLLSNNFSWTYPSLWNLQADFTHLFSGETQYFLCSVGPHNPWRSKMSTFWLPPFLILTASMMHSTNTTNWRHIKHFFHLLHPLKTFQATDETLHLDGDWATGWLIGLVHMKAWMGARMWE